MNELRIHDIIKHEMRDVRDTTAREDMNAIRRAAMRIASEARTAQQQAARTASQIGYMVTRGRTHL